MANDYERSFMDQIQRYRASGGDLDTLVTKRSSYPQGIVIIEDDPNGSTRLFHATLSGWRSSVEWLLKQGAGVHLGFPNLRLTPLHAAVEHFQHGAAFLLLDAGARLEDRDIYGCTALHLAARDGLTKMCKLLLSRGASLDSRDRSGRDPEARARSYNNMTTAAYYTLVKVRAAGGWAGYVAAPRRQLLVLRRALPALRERGRASPSSVLVHEALFLRDDVPDDVFSLVLKFWRSERDYDGGSFDVDYHCHTHYDSGDDHRDKSRWIVRL